MLKPLTSLLIMVGLLAGCATTGQQTSSTPASQGKPMPAETRVLYDRAIWSAQNGREDEAIELFRQMTKERPDIAIGYTNLGLLQLKKNQLDQAQASLEKAISLDPADAVAYNHLGVTLRNKGQFKQAKAAYKQALSIRSDYANAHLNLGILLDLYMQDLPGALSQYRQYLALAEDPQVEKWVVDLDRRISAGGK
jgi:tetratricopeptide (TPR) repeat protein